MKKPQIVPVGEYKPLTLTEGERRFLARHQCWFCDQRLDKDFCGAIYESCAPDTRERRRQECLRHYRPRGTA
jgi:hypothetical protein